MENRDLCVALGELNRQPSKFYDNLFDRLQNKDSLTVKNVSHQNFNQKCTKCCHVSQNKGASWRHAIQRHHLRENVEFFAFCPVRGCQFTAETFNMIKAHLISNHPGSFKIKTVIHAEDTADSTLNNKKANKVRNVKCPVDGCNFMTTNKKGLGAHNRWDHPKKKEASRRSSDPKVIPDSVEDKVLLVKPNTNDLSTPTDEKKIFKCPVQDCQYTKSRRNAITIHMNKCHPEEPHPDDLKPILGPGTGNTDTSLSTPVDVKQYLYLCPAGGCEYTRKSKGVVRRHMNAEHPDEFFTHIPRTEIKSEEDTIAGEDTETDSLSSVSRSARIKKSKKRFVEEEWQVTSRPKKHKLQENESYPLEIADSIDSKEVKKEYECPPEQHEIKSPDLKDEKLQKQVKVRLKPILISFPVVQECLIRMSKVHNTGNSCLDYNMTKSDGMLASLIGEHVDTCVICQLSPEIRVRASQLGQQRVGEHSWKKENESLKQKIRSAETELRKMVARISFLEGKLIEKTRNEVFTEKKFSSRPNCLEDALLFMDKREIENKKLINRISNLEKDLRGMFKVLGKDSESQKCSASENNLKLLEGVQKPVLKKKNDYWMVQGYRLLDINILRVALETAQKCMHNELVLTEVNPEQTKVDLATQLAFLCKQCGFQTIFCSSSFSDEWPSNYSVNKSFLAALGSKPYLSLSQLVKSSASAIKVNLRQKGKNDILRKKSKLILSLDRKSFTEDLGIDKPGTDIEEVLITPDLTATYESITDDTDDIEETKPDCFEDASTSFHIPFHNNFSINQEFEVKEELSKDLENSKLNDSQETLSIHEELESMVDSTFHGENDSNPISASVSITSGDDAEDCMGSINNRLSSLLDKIKDEAGEGDADRSTKVETAQPESAKVETPQPESAKPFIKIRSVDHLFDKTKLNRMSCSPEKSMVGSSWNTVEDLPGKPVVAPEEDNPIIATPIPPGTRLLASTIKHTTTKETPLPPGVYKMKKGSDEYVMVVKKDIKAADQKSESSTSQESSQGLNVLEGSLTSTGWRFNDSVTTTNPMITVPVSTTLKNMPGGKYLPQQQLPPRSSPLAFAQAINKHNFQRSNPMARVSSVPGLVKGPPSSQGGAQRMFIPISMAGGQYNTTKVVKLKAPYSDGSIVSRQQPVTLAGRSLVPSGSVMTTSNVNMVMRQGSTFRPAVSSNSGVRSVGDQKKVLKRSIGSFVLPKTYLPDGWTRNAIKAVNKETRQGKISVILRPPNSSIMLHNRFELDEYTLANNLPLMDPALFDIQLSSVNQSVDDASSSVGAATASSSVEAATASSSVGAATASSSVRPATSSSSVRPATTTSSVRPATTSASVGAVTTTSSVRPANASSSVKPATAVVVNTTLTPRNSFDSEGEAHTKTNICDTTRDEEVGDKNMKKKIEMMKMKVDLPGGGSKNVIVPVIPAKNGKPTVIAKPSSIGSILPKSRESTALSSKPVTPEPETQASDSEQDTDITTQEITDEILYSKLRTEKNNEGKPEDLDDHDLLEDSAKLCIDFGKNEDGLEETLDTDLNMQVDEECDILAPSDEQNISSIKDDVEMTEDPQIEDELEDYPTEEAQNDTVDCGGEEGLTKENDVDLQCSEAAKDFFDSVDEDQDEIGNIVDIPTASTDDAVNDNTDIIEHDIDQEKKSKSKESGGDDHEVSDHEFDNDLDGN